MYLVCSSLTFFMLQKYRDSLMYRDMLYVMHRYSCELYRPNSRSQCQPEEAMRTSTLTPSYHLDLMLLIDYHLATP